MSPPPRNRRPVIGNIKSFLVNFICAFVPSNKYRGLIREKLLYYRIFLGGPRLPIKKRSRPVSLAFGFDSGFARPTGVAIASLLANSKDRCSYNIYCVVDDSVTPDLKAQLAEMVKTLDRESALIFLEANRDFDQAQRGSWSLGVYYRLMLPALLPELDDVIYADGDVVFCRDLLELADLDLGENLVAGVLDGPGGYINSGFLVLNLARLRREKTYEVWVEESRRVCYQFPDQDLLNATCRGRILYLPIKFNFSFRNVYLFHCGDFIPSPDRHDLKYDTVVVHYAARPKPWRDETRVLSGLWWEYARLTPFYEYFLAELKP
jgi:lipopolysaccharide biosynthesis glycosyltransferase